MGLLKLKNFTHSFVFPAIIDKFIIVLGNSENSISSSKLFKFSMSDQKFS